LLKSRSKQSCEAGCLEIVEAYRPMHIVDDASMLQFDEYGRFDEKIGNILADDNPIVSPDIWLRRAQSAVM
jgi:hypothetical protein